MLSKPSFKEELRRYLEERAADPKREHIGTTNRQIIERWKRRTDADDIWDPLSAACPHHLAPADLVKAVIRFRARAQSIVNRIYGVTVPAPDVVALRKKLVDQGRTGAVQIAGEVACHRTPTRGILFDVCCARAASGPMARRKRF